MRVFILSFSGSFIYKYMWLSMIKFQLISCHFLFSNPLQITWKLQHLIKHVMLFHTSETLFTLLSFLRMLFSNPNCHYRPDKYIVCFHIQSKITCFKKHPLTSIHLLQQINHFIFCTLSLHFRPFYHGTYIIVLAYLNLWLSLSNHKLFGGEYFIVHF